MVLSVQRGYMYLDNTFNAEDIRKQLPKETDDFDKLTDRWREITSRMAQAGLALPACHEPRMCFPINFNGDINFLWLSNFSIVKLWISRIFIFVCMDWIFLISSRMGKMDNFFFSTSSGILQSFATFYQKYISLCFFFSVTENFIFIENPPLPRAIIAIEKISFYEIG